ncbi:unnamed protein product [Paramecium primaurelia]|uniref:Transmembrane protein n=1 Tax=Paramecium primaurelia TaxID=5886 RepID=A0A8S1QU39_PARPR|nr:unnamed protein product [Paramecium primaurelia]
MELNIAPQINILILYLTLFEIFNFIGKVQLGFQRLIQLHLQNFLRPNLNFIHSLNLNVGGVWASTDYNFQSFCHQLQGFSNFTCKPTCKTLDEIQATLDWQGSFRFKFILQMLYLQSIFKQFLNPNRPENYVQPYLIFFFCSKQNDGQYNIFVRKKRVTTDQEIIMYSIQKNEKLLPFKIMEVKENNLKFLKSLKKSLFLQNQYKILKT